MANPFRYRFRRTGTADDWSRPRRLRRIMRRVARRMARRGEPYRFRRRDKDWGSWFTDARNFRSALRNRLEDGPIGNYQFQVGGSNGPIFGVLKFKPAPRVLPLGEQVMEFAKAEIGTPYRFGVANGPEDPGTDAYDCSGFTQEGWSTVGVFLPHSSEMQRIAPNVFNFSAESACLPGDLVFFWFPNSRGISRGHASHVGLWLRPDVVIDTRSQSSPVAVRAIEEGSVIGFGRPQPGGQQR